MFLSALLLRRASPGPARSVLAAARVNYEWHRCYVFLNMVLVRESSPQKSCKTRDLPEIHLVRLQKRGIPAASTSIRRVEDNVPPLNYAGDSHKL